MRVKASTKPPIQNLIHEFLINLAFTMVCLNFKKSLKMAFGPSRVNYSIIQPSFTIVSWTLFSLVNWRKVKVLLYIWIKNKPYYRYATLHKVVRKKLLWDFVKKIGRSAIFICHCNYLRSQLWLYRIYWE